MPINLYHKCHIHIIVPRPPKFNSSAEYDGARRLISIVTLFAFNTVRMYRHSYIYSIHAAMTLIYAIHIEHA